MWKHIPYYTEEVCHALSEGAANMEVLDSGFTKTACWEKLLTWYLDLFPENVKKQVIERKSDPLFIFEDSKEIKAMKSV